MNLYGFAGGDPVNFSDPFGLMACPPACDGVSYGLDLFQRMFDSAVQQVKDAAADVSSRTVVYARGGMGALTTQVETSLDGKAAVRIGGSVGTDAISAKAGVRFNLSRAPVGSVESRASARVGPGVSVTATMAQVGANTSVTSIGIEGGVGLSRTSDGRGLPVSGSVQVPGITKICWGPGC